VLTRNLVRTTVPINLTMLSPDSPIHTAAEDKLNRKTFSESLAKALVGFSQEDSFVVGIHGKWGMGKSSILNLLVEQIEKDNETKLENEKLHVMRFNPWNFSDQNQLVFQFLRQFRAHLKGNQKEFKELLASLDDYAEALAPPLELLPYGKIFSSGMKIGIKGAQKVFGTAKDVDGLFDQIAEKAKKFKRRTIVLIDDIDRLSAAETRQIFQLVKLTARFPYVIYILAFDREAVSDALKQLDIDSGEEYLEKIVQVSFDIPPISEASLTMFFTAELDDLLKRHQPAHFDSTRFGNLFHAGLRKCFSSLRDVRRFINGLEFGLGLIGHELNGVDFIGIEAIRIFFPSTFNVIRNNKELFAGHVDMALESDGPQKYEARLTATLNSEGKLTEDLKDLLLQLFPKLSYAYGRTKYGHHAETEWEKTYRISTTRYFDAYFALVLPDSEISVQELTSFILAPNKETLTELLTKWARSGKLKNAIESLRYRLTEIRQDSLKNVFAALLSSGEIASEKGFIFAGQIPEYWEVRWALFDVLAAIPQENRVPTIKEAFSESTSLKTMINVIALIEKVKQENSNRHTEFSDSDLTEIKAIVVGRIRESAKDPNILIRNAALPVILTVWKNWGGSSEEVSAFITDAIKTEDDLISFLDNFISQTHSTAGRVIEIKNHLSMNALSEWMDVNELLLRLDKINEDNLSPEKREIAKIVRSELQLFKSKGMTPEQFDNSRLFD
jgi:predicted KAP-like P-loop ATPase